MYRDLRISLTNSFEVKHLCSNRTCKGAQRNNVDPSQYELFQTISLGHILVSNYKIENCEE